MANKKLHVMKSKAHEYFDPLSYNRTPTYKWLSKKLNIPEFKCHIGLFDIDTCQLVIRVCKRKQLDEGICTNQYNITKGYKRN